jgi:hypothetical protein
MRPEIASRSYPKHPIGMLKTWCEICGLIQTVIPWPRMDKGVFCAKHPLD